MPVICEFMDWLMALIRSDIILKVAFWEVIKCRLGV
jgi:hypothetical protein